MISPANPSMLDMRDSILMSDIVDPASYGSNNNLIWQIFAQRGMGWSATTVDHNDDLPVEAFDLPDITAIPNPFSPDGDGTKDTTTISSSFPKLLYWTIKVKDAGDNIVETCTGEGTSTICVWDGTDDSGMVVQDGTYSYTLKVADQPDKMQMPTVYGTVTVDTTPPTGSILINDDAASTKTTDVTLNLTCSDGVGGSGCAEMQLSDDGVFDTEPIEPVAESRSWTLPSGDGIKTVYVRYLDAAGNSSAIYSDDISLKSAYSINGKVTENSSGLGGVVMTLSGDTSATTATASDGTYGFTDMADGSYTVTPAMSGYTFSPAGISVTVVGADVSGVDFQAYLIVDVTPPTGLILINNNAVWTKTADVTLIISCTDEAGGSGCAEMQVSNDGVYDTEPYEPVVTSKSWTLTSGDGIKSAYVRYKDGAGNVSASFFDIIKLDTTKPVVSLVSDLPDPFNPSIGQVSTISFTVSDNLSGKCKITTKVFNASNVPVKTITRDNVSCPSGGAAGSVTWDGRNSTGNIVPAGTYTYTIQATDKASNISIIKQGTSTVQ